MSGLCCSFSQVQGITIVLHRVHIADSQNRHSIGTQQPAAAGLQTDRPAVLGFAALAQGLCVVFKATMKSPCRAWTARQLPHVGRPVVAATQKRPRQQQLRLTRASAANESALPENVDLSDPELQRQIDALLQELDPDLLMVCTSVCHWFPAAWTQRIA